MRILVLGAGVIGSVYAAKLQQAGHEVVMLARGRRLADLRGRGLVLQDAESADRTVSAVPCVGEVGVSERFDLVLVPVRAEQLPGTLPLLTAMTDGSDVLVFGNPADHYAAVLAALGPRVVFGFPAAGGTRTGPVVTYVQIRQQKTMLGEPDGSTTARVRRLQEVLGGAGFPTTISADIGAWLVGHAAFVVPIAFALYRVGGDAARLAADRATMRLMVLAGREAFTALRCAGNREVPANLRILYFLPTPVVVSYWRRVLAGPRGELWFAAHTRAATEEMRTVAQVLRGALWGIGRPTPHLDRLFAAETSPL